MKMLTIAIPLEVIVHDEEWGKKFTDDVLKEVIARRFASVFPSRIAVGTTKVVQLNGKPRPAVLIALSPEFGVEVESEVDATKMREAIAAAPRVEVEPVSKPRVLRAR